MATSIRSTGAWPVSSLRPAGAVPARTEAVSVLLGGHGDADAQAFAKALSLFEAGHWDGAFSSLKALADRGHPQASRLALMLVRRGPSLFGGRYAASAQQRRHWAAASD